MKSIKLNEKNLIKLGLTKEILTNKVEEWVIINDDIAIDFVKEIIYLGRKEFSNKLDFSLAMIKRSLLEQGKSDEEIESFFLERKHAVNKKLDKRIANIPEEHQAEYAFNMINKLEENLLELKGRYFDFEMNNIINRDSIEKNNPNKNSSNFSNHKYINDFVSKILNEEMSKFEAIKYINDFTTEKTIDLFLKEFNEVYYNCTNEFRLRLSDDIMLEIINSNIDNLEYTYLSDEKYKFSKAVNFSRKVLDFEFVINTTPKYVQSDKNIHKLIYVNELCIDFDPDYPFGHKGQKYYEVYTDFGNVKFLKEIFIYLNQKGDSNQDIKENVIDDSRNTFQEINLETNPYPKIFKNYKAFSIFKNLFEDFGNTKENLSNYSFIFHKMTYEDLIHNDLKQNTYYIFLGDFDISLNRIKPLADIGKIAFRQSIYDKAKT